MTCTDFQWYDHRVAKNTNDYHWICDQKWNSNYGKKVNRIGFYMDEYLALNLNALPNYLKNAWDVVGIISGHGKVRIGKSSVAQQVGLYIAWLIAGGKMKQREDWYKGEPNKFIVHRAPRRVVRFDLKENIVFSPEQLMDKAKDLYRKYGKHQVIIYDEGRAGLDSAKAMTAINKAMQDFFQECGVYGHIILIVLPSFFKLHEDYATARSLFLIDVYANKEMRRGFFNFYNEQQKEYLYLQGKKMVGTIGKYKSGYHSFAGRFTKFLPFDKDEYESEKMNALSDKTVMNKRDEKMMLQRNHALWMIENRKSFNREDFVEYWNSVFNTSMNPTTINQIVKGEEDKLKETFGLKDFRRIKRNAIQVLDSKTNSHKKNRASLEAIG